MSYRNQRPFQRAVQKYNALDAGDRDAFDSIFIDEKFATDALLRKLRLAQMGANRLNMNRSLDLKERGLDLGRDRLNLRRDTADDMGDLQSEIDRYGKKKGRRGRNISLLGLGLSTYQGDQERKRQLQIAEDNRKTNALIRKYYKGLL